MKLMNDGERVFALLVIVLAHSDSRNRFVSTRWFARWAREYGDKYYGGPSL